MTVVTKVIVNGARGPRGFPSGPLGSGSVDADSVSNDANEQADIFDKISLFSHSDTASSGTVKKKLQQNINPLDRPFSAVGNGTTNDRTALFNADAAGPITITANHRVSSNLTFTQQVMFVGDGRLTIDTGVTVTFSAGLAAGRWQIFYGVGNVAGLDEGWLEWFAGDAAGSISSPPVIECRASLQKGFNALNARGTMRAGRAVWLIDGATAITIASDRNFLGEMNGTVFQWQGAATFGFYIGASGTSYQSRVRGFRFEPSVAGTIPTSGTALDIRSSFCDVGDFVVRDAFNGTNEELLAGGMRFNYRLEGCRNYGRRIKGALNNSYHQNFIIEALRNWVSFSSISGTFQLGEVITLSTGQTGSIEAIYGSGNFRVILIGPEPAGGATVTGATSGATATLASITFGHAAGGTRVEEAVQAFQDQFGEGGLGGLYGFISLRTGSLEIDGPAFNRSTNVYYDTSYRGSIADGLYKWAFLSCWFASSPSGRGLVLGRCAGTRMVACQHINNGSDGLLILDTCVDTEIVAIDAMGNCVFVGGTADILVSGGAQRFRFIGGSAGYQGSTGITAPKAMVLSAGATNKFKVIGFDAPSGAITNGGTGAEQEWLGVSGVPDISPIAKYTSAANDAAAASAGVPVGGHYRNGSAIMIRVS